MYFNRFAETTAHIDMAATDEFASLLNGAQEVGTQANPAARYISRNVVANGLRFHVLEWGDPSSPTVLLLHGGNHTAHTWDLVSMALSPTYHVIAIDQRGHGDSEWPRDGDGTVTAMNGDLEALWDVLGLGKVRIVAHSRGGRAVMPLLARRDLAERLVLVDVAPIGGTRPDGPRPAGAGAGGFTAVREYESIDAYVAAVQRLDPSRNRESVLRTMRYNMIQRVEGKLVPKTMPLNVGSTEDIADPLADVSIDEMKSIACPVLLVRGGESAQLAPELARAFVAALPDARMVEVPRCGHNVHTQNTPGFLAEIVPFLAGSQG